MCFYSSLPDDGWVKLTGVQVDETEGNGNGKLPCHAESNGQRLDVLWKRGGELGRGKEVRGTVKEKNVPCLIV